MTFNSKTVFFLVLGILLAWFLYIERGILTPFILGGIFAYIFNPVVKVLTQKLKVPRGLSTAIIFLIMVSLVVGGSIWLGHRIFSESSELIKYVTKVTHNAKNQINDLPDYLRGPINYNIVSFQKSKQLSSKELFSFFPRALSELVDLVMFLFSSFYFLKEGRSIFDKLLGLIPRKSQIEYEILLNRINAALGNYLRGQLILISFVAFVIFVSLSILGVKFALLIAIFSGFAEIVPIVGPVTAALLAALVVMVTGHVNFSLAPYVGALIVLGIYFVLRHIQDYFVSPHVIGKIARLHPLLIIFAALAGEHIWGILGLMLAVPLAAIVRILLEFFLEKVNDGERKQLIG